MRELAVVLPKLDPRGRADSGSSRIAGLRLCKALGGLLVPAEVIAARHTAIVGDATNRSSRASQCISP